MSERERMIAGEAYDPRDPGLASARARIQSVVRRYNELDDGDQDERDALLRGALGRIGERVVLQSGLRFEYGFTIELGDDVFMNYGCVLLDVCPIRIGSRVLFGPNVQLLTPTHPLDPVERSSGRESGRPITVGDDVWLGGGVIVNPGVTIGSGTTVGAGSVVPKDLPERVFAAGVPARVVREL
ncbi:MAG: sugar O-acetyltransferase [Planctomycetota bacterium]